MNGYACVDVGTTRIKLGVYDASLERVHSEDVRIPVSEDGLHDPQAVYDAVVALLRKGRELGSTSAGLATYRASVVAWKKDGTPLTPIVTWINTDSRRTYEKLPWHVRAVSKVPPFDLIISPYSPLVRFRRLLEIRPDIEHQLRNGDAMAWTLESYLAYRLTGRFVSDATSATLTGLIHPKTMKVIGIAKSLMGMELPIPEVLENAGSFGTAEGLELRALVADQQAACVSEGVFAGNVGKLTNGTGTFLDIPVETYTSVKGLVPIVILKHRGVAYHGLEGYLPTTGRALDLLLRLGILRSYEELEAPPSGSPMRVVPALAGLQIPRAPDAKGLFYGITSHTDRASVISGLLDAIAFHVRLVLDTSRRAVTALRANGNLSRSTGLMKRISSVTGLPIERQRDLEGTMKGLALLQALSDDKLKLEEIASTRKGIEVISEGTKDMRDGDYRAWTTLAESLKNFRT
jgi:glycerol kinase